MAGGYTICWWGGQSNSQVNVITVIILVYFIFYIAYLSKNKKRYVAGRAEFTKLFATTNNNKQHQCRGRYKIASKLNKR